MDARERTQELDLKCQKYFKLNYSVSVRNTGLSHYSKVLFMPLHFHEGLILIPVSPTEGNSKRIFTFKKWSLRGAWVAQVG